MSLNQLSRIVVISRLSKWAEILLSYALVSWKIEQQTNKHQSHPNIALLVEWRSGGTILKEDNITGQKYTYGRDFEYICKVTTLFNI